MQDAAGRIFDFTCKISNVEGIDGFDIDIKMYITVEFAKAVKEKQKTKIILI